MPDSSFIRLVAIRGRSELTTFMKAFRGYARLGGGGGGGGGEGRGGGGGGEGMETTVRFFFNKINIWSLDTDDTAPLNLRRQINIS